MKTETKKITQEDFRKITQDERWGGFGYIGQKQSILNSLTEMHFTKENQESRINQMIHLMNSVDNLILEFVNENSWTYEKLFAWVNSKMGRHFADEMLNEEYNATFVDRWITARNKYLKNFKEME